MPKLIRKRGKDTYQLIVSAGYDEMGKQRTVTKTVHAKNMREAKHELVLLKAEIQKHGSSYLDTPTVAEFAALWLDNYCRKELSPKTIQSYTNHLEKRIVPLLGKFQIGKLKPMDVINFINHLQRDGKRFDGKSGNISNQAVRYCARTLSSMLQCAVRWGIIESNPAKGVARIKVKRKKIKLPDENGIAKMLEALHNEPLKYRVIIMLAIDSDMRRGEIMALQWPEVNLDKGLVRVCRNNIAIPGKGIITKAPKNDSSNRIVNLSQTTINLLDTYKRWQESQKELLANQWVDDGKQWVFTQWNGKPMFPETPSHWFRNFLKRHDLQPMPFHGLRHLTATILIAQHTPLKNVSSRLGHTDIRTTANIYSDALQSVDKLAANQMDQFFTDMTKKEEK